MRYEYIIKKPEQTICIEVSIYCDYSKIEYRVSDIGVKSKGKRKFEFVAARLRDDHGYRHTDYDKRSDYVKNEYLKIVTEEEIRSAIAYAYEQIKPNYDAVSYWVC